MSPHPVLCHLSSSSQYRSNSGRGGYSRYCTECYCAHLRELACALLHGGQVELAPLSYKGLACRNPTKVPSFLVPPTNLPKVEFCRRRLLSIYLGSQKLSFTFSFFLPSKKKEQHEAQPNLPPPDRTPTVIMIIYKVSSGTVNRPSAFEAAVANANHLFFFCFAPPSPDNRFFC